MNPWIEEIEPKIRKLYDEEIENSGEITHFRITENFECEIQKEDGSITRIARRIIDLYESDNNSRQMLLKKLKDFKIHKPM